MKKILVLALLTAFSTSSHAIHIYRSLHCENATHKLDYKGNYMIGGAYGVSKIGSENDVNLFEAEGEADDSFKIEFLSSKVTSSSETPKDCSEESKGSYAFSEDLTKSNDLIKVLRLTPDEEVALDLKSGTVLEMSCTQVISYPGMCN